MSCLLSIAVGFATPAQGFEGRWNPRLSPEVLVVRETRPAVVCVEAFTPVVSLGSLLDNWTLGGRPHQGVRQRQETRGSGVVVFEDGYIVTNYHVVSHANRIRVRFDQEIDPQAYDAKLVSHDASEDLALIKIEAERALDVVRLGTSSDIELGERVVAIGNPYGEGLSVSAGIVSALHRDLLASSHMFRDLIQTDASINPGSSGGPLLNMNGELIGINTVVKAGAENVGYAIPVDTVRQVLQDQLLGDAHARAWLGFEVEPDDLLSVKDVVPGGPAAVAGLQPGDRLIAFNGTPLLKDEDFHRARLRILPNEVIRLSCRRGAEEVSVELRGWDKVDGILFQRAGLTLEHFAVGRASMVRVHRLSEGGAAARLGLLRGDVIEAVRLSGRGQAWRIQSPADFAQLIAHTESGTELELDVLRDEDGDGLLGIDELYKGSMEIE